MPETIYIVRETNVRADPDLIAPTTIWAWFATSEAYRERGFKVVGPIPAFFADQVVSGLRPLLERLGVAVTIESAIDD